jgi:hypothetical protein
LNVSAIFSKVHDEPVGAGQFHQHGCGDGVRFYAAPRLSQGRHMIDVDAESRHVVPPPR